MDVKNMLYLHLLHTVQCPAGEVNERLGMHIQENTALCSLQWKKAESTLCSNMSRMETCPPPVTLQTRET